MGVNGSDNSTLLRHIRAFARRGAMPHALILSGSGDRAGAARYAAAAMLCTAQDKPCLQCPQCRKVLQDIHPDVLSVEDEERKFLPVDAIRDFRSEVYIRPNEGARKVALFPRGEQLSEQDQNVLLKIVEEGPAYAAFIFCVENSALLLPTVRSRCVELKLQQEDAAAAPDMALLEAFGSAKRGRAAAYAVSLENRKLKREQLQTLLQTTWRVCAEALLLQNGKPAAEGALAEGALYLKDALPPRRLAALTELVHRYALECQYNVGVGHVLGALAAEWENTI
jgi:DNA polymerase III delta prime subunit